MNQYLFIPGVPIILLVSYTVPRLYRRWTLPRFDTYYCKPKYCSRKETCNHHIVEPFRGKRIKEDLSGICLPDFRLYIEGNRRKRFPGKEYYIELLKFYDSEYCGRECNNRKPYTDIKTCHASRIDCKFGECYTCVHPKHPDNIAINRAFSVIEAELEAFEKADIDEGRVIYTCPICGGEAIAIRYTHDDRYHGLGSGCKKCGTYHT